eukprot:6176943-Pleurochrysis_carterae.AAC.1
MNCVFGCTWTRPCQLLLRTPDIYAQHLAILPPLLALLPPLHAKVSSLCVAARRGRSVCSTSAAATSWRSTALEPVLGWGGEQSSVPALLSRRTAATCES